MYQKIVEKIFAPNSIGIKISEMISKMEDTLYTYEFNKSFTQDICSTRNDVIKISFPI